MGFNRVYQSLADIFPQVDSRILKAVAIEHSKNVDAAVEIVLTEIIPVLSPSCIVSDLPVTNGRPPQRDDEDGDDEFVTSQLRQRRGGLISTNSSSGSSLSAAEHHSDDVTLHSGPSFFIENMDDAPGDGRIFWGYSGKELICFGKDHGNFDDTRLPVKDFHLPSNSVNEGSGKAEILDAGSQASELVHLDGFREYSQSSVDSPHELSGPVQAKCDNNSEDMLGIINEQAGSHYDNPNMVYCDGSFLENSLSNDNTLGAEKAAYQLEASNPQDHVLDFPSSHLASYSGQLDYSCEKLDSQYDEDNPTLSADINRSGHVWSIDPLKDIIQHARSNKKVLFTAMEEIMNMMREVELKEKAAEEAQQEAARGGLDIHVRVEELKQKLMHAKEANNMRAGEVYGEKAILATEAKELQARLLSLAEERDKSLDILDEMRVSLEARLAAAEEMQKAAEQEKLEKEGQAYEALFEQESIIEKVVQESKILQQQADENSKLREFLMEHGHVVDNLQGEIMVICQDVRLLKQNFDERLPLSKSISSSQTSCILASTGSLGKITSLDLVMEPLDAAEILDKGRATALMNAESSYNPSKEVLDDDWDFFEKETEL